MVDFKKVKAPNNTITRNPAVLAAKADNNIYEAVPKDLIRLPSR